MGLRSPWGNRSCIGNCPGSSSVAIMLTAVGWAMEPQNAISVEVLTYAPAAFFHCQHCEFIWQQTGATKNVHREQLASSLPDDLIQQYQALSDWAREIMAAYGERIVLRVIDVASLEGWFKSVRYGVHRFPAVIIDRKEKIVGNDFDRASALIRERMASARPEPVVGSR